MGRGCRKSDIVVISFGTVIDRYNARRLSLCENGLSDLEIALLIIGDDVGFLEERTADDILRFVGSSSDGKVILGVVVVRVFRLKVKGGVREFDLDVIGISERIADAKGNSRFEL